jgi:uncharacterized protein YkwD
MRKTMSALSFFLLCIFSTTTFAICPASDTYQAEMLRYINNFRATGGTCGGYSYPASAKLSNNRFLRAAATGHAIDMAKYNYFSHTGRNGSSPTDRIRATGYLTNSTSWSTAENIGAGTSRTTALAQFNGWKASASHCKAMLTAKYQHMGIACAYSSSSTYRHYWVLNMGRGGQI